VRDLIRWQRSRSPGMDSHRENPAQRTANKSNSSFTIICHTRHSRHKSLGCESVFCEESEIRNKGAYYVQKAGDVRHEGPENQA